MKFYLPEMEEEGDDEDVELAEGEEVSEGDSCLEVGGHLHLRGRTEVIDAGVILTLTECLPRCCLTSLRARRETSSPAMMRVRKAQVRQ